MSFLTGGDAVVQGLLIGNPIAMTGLALIFAFMYFKSENEINKHIFLIILLSTPFFILYPLSVVDDFYLKVIYLYAGILAFPIFIGLWNLFRILFHHLTKTIGK
jgi:hypothetical protein